MLDGCFVGTVARCFVQRAGDRFAHSRRESFPHLRIVVRANLACGTSGATKSRMDEVLTLEFDGGSRGNPGPAGIGVVVRAADGTALMTLGRFIGKCTNNVAEYRALITAMEEA